MQIAARKFVGRRRSGCLLWPDSLIVLDMRGETYEATAGYRQNFSRVVRFSPADEKGETEKYNPLDFVSINPDQRDIDINSIAAALLPTPKNDAYWIQDCKLRAILRSCESAEVRCVSCRTTQARTYVSAGISLCRQPM